MTGRGQGRQTDGEMIGNIKNCAGIIREIEGKQGRLQPRVDGKKDGWGGKTNSLSDGQSQKGEF